MAADGTTRTDRGPRGEPTATQKMSRNVPRLSTTFTRTKKSTSRSATASASDPGRRPGTTARAPPRGGLAWAAPRPACLPRRHRSQDRHPSTGRLPKAPLETLALRIRPATTGPRFPPPPPTTWTTSPTSRTMTTPTPTPTTQHLHGGGHPDRDCAGPRARQVQRASPGNPTREARPRCRSGRGPSAHIPTRDRDLPGTERALPAPLPRAPRSGRRPRRRRRGPHRPPSPA